MPFSPLQQSLADGRNLAWSINTRLKDIGNGGVAGYGWFLAEEKSGDIMNLSREL